MSAFPSNLPIDLSEAEARVLSLITEDAWMALACELIPAGQPDSENPLDPDEPPAREEGAALVVAAKLREMGFTVDLVSRREGRPNVIGVLCGTAAGPSLMLNDHLDTYPAGDWAAWTMTGGHPYRPTRHGDRLYARGTSDTRGNLACTLLAVRAIRDAGIPFGGTLQCVYTVDEEKNGPDGSIFLLDEKGLSVGP
jgi:acetylornithine deacetylase/succinyl-diaminopimelate desuccinylase-like protein